MAVTPDQLRRLGYKDGLLDKPFACLGSAYREGYANGQTDRRFFGIRAGWVGDSNRAIDKAVY